MVVEVRRFFAQRPPRSPRDPDQARPNGPGGDQEVDVEERQKTAIPKRYKVIFHNDDYTTMDFVVEILETVFNKPPAEAYRIMMAVHTQGQGLCGVYPFEVAETKVTQVNEFSRAHQHPLLCTLEKA